MTLDRPIIRVPTLKRAILEHFSLYEDRPRIVVEFRNGVYCLAGANGLGKSTFLAALGFGLTGIVADPDRKFVSLAEYYEDSRRFSRDYFTGRISTQDRSSAQITIEFDLNGRQYTLIRGMFEPTALRSLTITDPRGEYLVQATAQIEDDAAAIVLHDQYAAAIREGVGVASFEQYIFMHHFLLTFDERRHLLFWDPEVARQAIYLAFGVNAESARQADEWQRSADRLESQARQAQYQATAAGQRLTELMRPSDGVEDLDPKLADLYDSLSERERTFRAELEQRRLAAEDAQLRYATAAAEHHALVRDYEREFNESFTEKAAPEQHPIIQKMYSESTCVVCGTHDDTIAQRVARAVASAVCPICESPIAEPGMDDSRSLERLKSLDGAIAIAKARLDASAEDVRRTNAEVQAGEASYRDAVAGVTDFLASNERFMGGREAASPISAELITQYEAERVAAQERRDRFRQRRDEFRARLKPVHEEITQKYLAAEAEFLDRFQALAVSFIGLDLQVSMELKARGAELALIINGSRRRRTTQLSESQRYFVDIALRMALVEYMTAPEGKSTLFVDTPEGSLDITYEERAGEMFSNFTRQNHRLLMTANINSSRLVARLAAACGRDRMKIERMTDWTTLSEVQARNESLFEQAYARFERALDTGVVE